MMLDVEKQERRRLELQSRLDDEKSQGERNRLGQFATPTALAADILSYAKTLLPDKEIIRFLDPAIGTGSFYSAFLRVFGAGGAHFAVGFEIDEHYGNPARELWSESDLTIRPEDFTKASPPAKENEKADLIICNPPYVRHHHLSSEDKKRLGSLVSSRHGITLSGLSGLYCYFLCLSIDWMAKGSIAAWLIPSEFMDVNYGAKIKEFLLSRVALLHVHRFSPQDAQFGDALVSSAIVCIKNERPNRDFHPVFSFGGSLLAPKEQKSYSIGELREVNKWTRLPESVDVEKERASRFTIGDFFDVKRGIATGANDFFILSPSEIRRRSIPPTFLTPILPSPRYVKSDFILGDDRGVPDLEKLGFLFSSGIPEEVIREKFPKVGAYLEEGRARGIHERYLCRNRRPWYLQENRDVAPFLCTYMGRSKEGNGSKPFRFILNRSRAIAANVYLMLYPNSRIKKLMQDDPALMEKIWAVLQSIPARSLLSEGRVYGGGLYKMEPKELLNAPADALADLLPENVISRARQMSLF